MTAVAVYSYAHSVTYVADNILRHLKEIIRLSGLDPSKLAGEWTVLLAGISAWIASKHLETVSLEIYNPSTNALILRWDISVSYSWSAEAGSFWTDIDALKYEIKKMGLLPSQVAYRVLVNNKDGRPDVVGWSKTAYRSTDGMVRQSLGNTIEHNGLGAGTSYLRRAS
ncbi:MAG: HORMA domain containing protein [Burkholderiales bacterium]